MTDTFIEETLITALKTLTKYITSTNTAYQNESFTPPAEGGWYEVDFLPAPPVQSELGESGQNRWTGLFQVTICVPLNSGKEMSNYRYNMIAGLFKRGSFFSGVEVVNIHRSTNLLSEHEGVNQAHYRLPVRIEYKADLEN